MVLGFNVKVDINTHFCVPWQGWKNLAVRWGRGPWVRGNSVSLRHRHLPWSSSTGQRQPAVSPEQMRGSSHGRSSHTGGCWLFFFTHPFPKTLPTCSPTSGVSPIISERLCLPLSCAHVLPCLCTKARLAYSVQSRQPK